MASEYKPPKLLSGSHLETLYPHFFRKIVARDFTPIEITTPDQDILEADHYKNGSPDLIILSHGLEGNSRRDYMLGMASVFSDHSYDVLAWSYRGCGAKMNKLPRLYHSGATDDLHIIIDYADSLGYKSIMLIGFSLGGNLTLKYVGEVGQKINPKLKAAVAVSVPLDLDAGCRQLSKPTNYIYSYRFLTKLKKKIRLKNKQYPNLVKINKLAKIRDLRSFDDTYTAPLHGFKDADDYYKQCSSINYTQGITIPTLIINAINDPFLPKECYPAELLAKNSNITFEMPNHGGHVGFYNPDSRNYSWLELRVLDFVKALPKLN